MVENFECHTFYNPDLFSKLTVCSFENTEFPIYSEYDKILTQFYGDYMTPPPADQQNPFTGIKPIQNNKYGVRYNMLTKEQFEILSIAAQADAPLSGAGTDTIRQLQSDGFISNGK